VVAAVEAAGGGAEHPVMSGIVAGDAADHRALDAALGGGGRRREDDERGDDGGCSEQGFHGEVSGEDRTGITHP
jgi:hypothetical protein